MDAVSEQDWLATLSYMFLPPSPSLQPSARSTSRGPALPSMWEVEMAAVQGCSDDRGVLTEGESR